MIRYILDTDHVSLYQRGHPLIRARAAAVLPAEIAVTIISFEEQVRGRLARVRAAANLTQEVERYARLQETLAYFSQVHVLPFDDVAAQRFLLLNRQRIRIGTQDLRIAAIALVNGCTVVTRNRRDFERVPGLAVEDWTAPDG